MALSKKQIDEIAVWQKEMKKIRVVGINKEIQAAIKDNESKDYIEFLQNQLKQENKNECHGF